jgi:DNA ligase (NAD+)
MHFNSHLIELEKLKELGFTINPLNKTCNGLEEVWSEFKKLDSSRNSLNYPIDGLVVKIDDNNLSQKLGVIGKTPRAWCAIKFEAVEVTSKLLSLTYQVGRTGKITPVANLEPTLLMGTTIKRATLHNIKEVTDYNLHVGDTLIIRKAGDIIPEIVSVIKNLRTNSNPKCVIPTVCPSCNSNLVSSKTQIDLFCPNKQNCPEQLKLGLSYFAKRSIANIDGLSEKTINKLTNLYGSLNIGDLYSLDYSRLCDLEGFGDKSIDNLKSSIDKSRQIEDYKFLAGIGIDGIGLESAKLICALMQKKFTPNL